MRSRSKSLLTLVVLGFILVLAAAWGWSAATEPLPERADPPLCVETAVPAGETVVREQVAVSVFNASTRNGLASSMMDLLTERGFIGADTGNAPEGTTVPGVQIWSNDPENPAAQLVSQQFKRAKIVPGDPLGRGVTVVVGDNFKKLGKDVDSVTSAAAATICSPPGL
ncbi:LytR C-terminal domain-containing protein [Nocardioides sp. InS609-2]|uniref:LytR C-terminal domain-containing protein n=1 Tax=Nocardioides sp. InS609-2 TaxID=2760705 RepID=UPI0018371B50|nr:LytR C-terminal domain-containing protein [Nocardioides sp. InS609-2]MBA3782961.1 LytR C-terminal domain-containing protein [Nocardioides sp.]